MLHVNRATLLGHAGRDPEIREIRGGERIATFSLATTQRWKDRSGEPAEATEWHRIVVFGTAVDAVERRVAKGATVLVEGRIARREFTDKREITRQITEVIVAGPQGMVNVVAPRRTQDGSGDATA